MAQVIASVEIECYDDGTYEVSKDSEQGVENEAAEKPGHKVKSLDEALTIARGMLGEPGEEQPEAMPKPAPKPMPKAARMMPGALSMR